MCRVHNYYFNKTRVKVCVNFRIQVIVISSEGNSAKKHSLIGKQPIVYFGWEIFIGVPVLDNKRLIIVRVNFVLNRPKRTFDNVYKRCVK